MELQVRGMTCDGCANAVRRSIGKVAPAARVEIELASGRVRVDGTADAAAVARAIEGAGFKVAG
ncbi:MAG: heavy-metal-associated domain-containing protein [Rhodospirillales bacterium]|nr:heavy-metal-associated domain-containing protein [Rhodospirillales bacterium]